MGLGTSKLIIKGLSVFDLDIRQPVEKNEKHLISRYVNDDAHGVSLGACKEAEGRSAMCNNLTHRFVWWLRLIHRCLPLQ